MTNRYLSKHAKGETHFHRTDPWRDVPFDEPVGSSWAPLALIGIILTFIALLILGAILT